MEHLLVEYVYHRESGKKFGLFLDTNNSRKVYEQLKKYLNSVRKDVLEYFEIVWRAEERLNDYLCNSFDMDYGDVIIRPEQIVLTLNSKGLRRFSLHNLDVLEVVLELDESRQVGFCGNMEYYNDRGEKK